MSEREKTIATEFKFIPVIDRHLLAVREGIDTDFAISEATCLDLAVMELLADAVQGGMSPTIAHLCRFAMDAAAGLRKAVNVAG